MQSIIYKRERETMKRTNKRDKARLEALYTKASERALKERTQSDTCMCYDDSVEKINEDNRPYIGAYRAAVMSLFIYAQRAGANVDNSVGVWVEP